MACDRVMPGKDPSFHTPKDNEVDSHQPCPENAKEACFHAQLDSGAKAWWRFLKNIDQIIRFLRLLVAVSWIKKFVVLKPSLQ